MSAEFLKEGKALLVLDGYNVHGFKCLIPEDIRKLDGKKAISELVRNVEFGIKMRHYREVRDFKYSIYKF